MVGAAFDVALARCKRFQTRIQGEKFGARGSWTHFILHSV